MEGDPRNPRVSLLKKYDIPIDHLSYEYIEKCNSKKELERIIRILRSGEEGSYPDLLKVAEEKLQELAPESRVLRTETPILTKDVFSTEVWNEIESNLLSWEEEMKVMDSSLNFEKTRVVGNKNMPAVRKPTQLPEKKVTPNSVSVKSQNNQKNERIKAGDYAAWDKFDVDTELLKLDIEEERKQEENSRKLKKIKKQVQEKKIELEDIDKDSYSSLELQVLANQAKDRGNECFKSGDYNSALKYYNVSINFCPTANAFNNRAMTYLKLKDYNQVVLDCTKVLKLEENNVKALHRRATAYQNMSNSNDSSYDNLAWVDLCKILRIEPNNKVVQTDLQKLRCKLGLEDVGKKFRMPIYEGSGDAARTVESRSLGLDRDDSVNVENLPLTYYGPSTSTFQCEPYSRIHRALVGSSITGQIMCKCNSNITRQNPLCQACGEAMSTPKPSNKIKAKPKDPEKPVCNIENKDKAKVHGEISEVIENKSPKCVNDTKVKESNQNEEVDKDKIESNIVKNESQIVTENIEKETNELDNKTDLNVSDKTDIQAEESLKVTESNKESSDVNKISNSSYKNVEESSSEVSNHVSKKSKNKKKKSKERKHLESVKIVHADKYLHPTGVEPKVKLEPSEPKEVPTNQFKDFVPNKKCSIGGRIREDTRVPFTDDVRFEKDLSLEGNKENISENRSPENVNDHCWGENDGGVKKDEAVTAFEFVKCWEELKKSDETFTKRAEIIRMIKPSDLGKVIGFKLDSEMLSCLLKCLDRHFIDRDPKLVAEFLKQLPQIPRFGLVTMFLGDTDKQVMRKLIETAERQGFSLCEAMKRLAITS